MIIEKNTNKNNLQYATPELRQRINEHLDSVGGNSHEKIISGPKGPIP